MRKIVLSNIQALDTAFRQYSIGAGGLFGYNGLSLEVNSTDECPICHFGIDLSQNSWWNYHDIHSSEQKKFNIFSIHICPHCHLSLIHISSTEYRLLPSLSFTIMVRSRSFPLLASFNWESTLLLMVACIPFGLAAPILLMMAVLLSTSMPASVPLPMFLISFWAVSYTHLDVYKRQQFTLFYFYYNHS